MSDELLAQAEIGEQARRFVESELGRCILGMAEQEVRQAQEALSVVNPTDSKAVEDLQNHVWRARKFGEWLKELIQTGENAIATWRQQKHES